MFVTAKNWRENGLVFFFSMLSSGDFMEGETGSWQCREAQANRPRSHGFFYVVSLNQRKQEDELA